MFKVGDKVRIKSVIAYDGTVGTVQKVEYPDPALGLNGAVLVDAGVVKPVWFNFDEVERVHDDSYVDANGYGLYAVANNLKVYLGNLKNLKVSGGFYNGQPYTPPMREVVAYISGPMTGKDDYNFAAFDEVAEKLKGRTITLDGEEVRIGRIINPAQLDRDEGRHGLTYHDLLLRDLRAILEESNVLILFDDWQNSRGANLEMYIATQAGIPVVYYDRVADAFDYNVSLSVPYQAQSIVLGARRFAYGHPLDNFTNIARLWDAVLRPKLADGQSIDIRDVFALMTTMKIAREYNSPKEDNQVDTAGYAYAYEEAKREHVRRGGSLDVFLNAPIQQLYGNTVPGADSERK